MLIALCGFVAAVVAALAAAADGALLATDAEPPATVAHRGFRSDARARSRRALLVARVVFLVGAAAASALLLGIDRRPPIGAMLLVLVVVMVYAALLDAVPRAIGASLGRRGAPVLARVTGAADVVFAPLVIVGDWLEATLMRSAPRLEPDGSTAEMPTQPFPRLTPSRGAPSSPTPQLDQRALLQRVLALRDSGVEEIMVPRVSIVGIERDMPWSEVVDRVRSSEHARLPVYNDTIDNIIGVLYAKDLLAAILSDTPPEGGWATLVRPGVFIPEAKTVEAQLRDFRASGTHIAIVVDEYGGTAGLVTIEDVLEEVVGDIRDEYDVEEPPIEVRDGRRYWVSGRVTLDDLSDALHHRFEREDVTTVGGLVYEALGRVPRAGEQLAIEGFRVVVERVVNRRIERVYFERAEQLAEHS